MNNNFNNNRQGGGNQHRQQGNNNRPAQGGRPTGGHQQAPSLDTITAPYNFVPLSSKVFLPNWADQVSHDLPFKDSICGELTCELVTDTPVYVRNGGKWEHNDVMTNPEAQSFFRVGKQIMIPGTSIKGMLGNVIEIASFGKMNKVDNHRYSIRDLQNRSAYLNKMKEVRSGWLCRNPEDEGWSIIPCEYALISHTLLQNEAIKKAQKSLSKYETWGWNKLQVNFRYKNGSPNNRVTSLGDGQPGTLVFTGQPKANTGGKFDKKNEFIFFDANEKRLIPVSSAIQKDINFLYTNPNTGKPYDEWKHWSTHLEKGKRVPIFYQMNGNQLGTFGFTRMYRLPYANSVSQTIEHSSKKHGSTKPDLAETIFGFVNGSDSALKGRVSISAAVATKVEHGKPIQPVFGAPKPSFYPNYLVQPDPKRQYTTFMDDDCYIRGWKRYPVRQLQAVLPPPEGTDNVATRLIPLKEGACFTFSIKLHNLKPVELGALVWALTWGGNPKLRHSLGMGKAMGFGVVGISIKSADIDWQTAMQEFEKLMQQEAGGNWLGTAQMEQLLAMANPASMPQCGVLKHLHLAPGAGNEFVNAKKARLALLPHVKPKAIEEKHQPQPSAKQQSVPDKPASMADLLGKFGKKRN
jgi:CRISPR-associated protein (TIGR03986 family)